jgi:hypothetical protein
MPISRGKLGFSSAWDWRLIILSVMIQVGLATWLSHAYDMPIFMATGYLVATGLNPYVPQDLSRVFHNASFQGITSIGYFPPWALLLGLLYTVSYGFVPNLLFYNMAIKLPVIAANIGLAYLVVHILTQFGAKVSSIRWAWAFLLFNPLLIIFGAAWGQFDALVAVFALLSVLLFYQGRVKTSAILIALAISLKPTAVPILVVLVIYLVRKSMRQTSIFLGIFLIGIFIFCILPFGVFGWSLDPILHNWNAHFTVGGGMSWMSFYELWKNTYALPGLWWLLGLLWIPALAISALYLKPRDTHLPDLLAHCTAFILIFFLMRTWLSEPNIILVLPFLVILSVIGYFPRRLLVAACLIPLVFTVLNTSLFQLLFPAFPTLMDKLLAIADRFRFARLLSRSILALAWQVTGWWIVVLCLRFPQHFSSEKRYGN